MWESLLRVAVVQIQRPQQAKSLLVRASLCLWNDEPHHIKVRNYSSRNVMADIDKGASSTSARPFARMHSENELGLMRFGCSNELDAFASGPVSNSPLTSVATFRSAMLICTRAASSRLRLVMKICNCLPFKIALASMK